MFNRLDNGSNLSQAIPRVEWKAVTSAQKVLEVLRSFNTSVEKGSGSSSRALFQLSEHLTSIKEPLDKIVDGLDVLEGGYNDRDTYQFVSGLLSQDISTRVEESLQPYQEAPTGDLNLSEFPPVVLELLKQGLFLNLYVTDYDSLFEKAGEILSQSYPKVYWKFMEKWPLSKIWKEAPEREVTEGIYRSRSVTRTEYVTEWNPWAENYDYSPREVHDTVSDRVGTRLIDQWSDVGFKYREIIGAAHKEALDQAYQRFEKSLPSVTGKIVSAPLEELLKLCFNEDNHLSRKKKREREYKSEPEMMTWFFGTYFPETLISLIDQESIKAATKAIKSVKGESTKLWTDTSKLPGFALDKVCQAVEEAVYPEKDSRKDYSLSVAEEEYQTVVIDEIKRLRNRLGQEVLKIIPEKAFLALEKALVYSALKDYHQELSELNQDYDYGCRFFEAVQKGDKKSAHHYNTGEIHDYDPRREAQFYLRRKIKYFGGEEARRLLNPLFGQLFEGVKK